MPSCVVPTCKNAAGLKKKQDGITFHVFPTDEERKTKWTEIIQRVRLEEFWKPSQRSVVCSMHFEDKYFYETKCGLKRLKKEGFPNKKEADECIDSLKQIRSQIEEVATLLSQSENNQTIQTMQDLAIAAEGSCSCKQKSKYANQPHSPTPNSEIGDVDISDLDYIYDTPKEAKLRSELRRKQILSEKHVKLIKTLQQKNRRLAKKNVWLTSILKKIKNSRYVNDDV